MDQTNLLTHKCGLCNQSFQNEDEYVAHKCNVTGFTPMDIEHQGEEFKAISEGALIRGTLRKELVNTGLTPDQADTISASVINQEQADSILKVFKVESKNV